MAAGGEAAGRAHGGNLAAHDRNLAGGDVVDVAGVEADEDVLAGDLALGVAVVHADEVEVAGAMHGGAAVSLDQGQRRGQLLDGGDVARDVGEAAAEARVVVAAQ